MQLDRLDLAGLECAAKQLRQIIDDPEYSAAVEWRAERASAKLAG